MFNKKLLISLLALSISLTGVPFQGIKEASAAVKTSDASYASQFNSFTLAKSYKDLDSRKSMYDSEIYG